MFYDFLQHLLNDVLPQSMLCGLAPYTFGGQLSMVNLTFMYSGLITFHYADELLRVAWSTEIHSLKFPRFLGEIQKIYLWLRIIRFMPLILYYEPTVSVINDNTFPLQPYFRVIFSIILQKQTVNRYSTFMLTFLLPLI